MIKINNVPVGNSCYPNNERILKSIEESKIFTFDMKFEGDSDIFTLIMYKKYFWRRNNIVGESWFNDFHLTSHPNKFKVDLSKGLSKEDAEFLINKWNHSQFRRDKYEYSLTKIPCAN